MEVACSLARVLSVLLLIVPMVTGIDTDLTVDVKAGVMECFYQTVKEPTTLEIEYQVIDGGDLDIGFSAHSPEGRVLAIDGRKSENAHRFEATTLGDYKFCLDNSFSHISRKLVYFEVMSDEDNEDDWKPDKDEIVELVDMTIEDFKTIMTKVKNNLEKSQQLQNMLKTYEARDRNIQENNFTRVNLLSCVQLLVMITVGLVQVIMIRKLFADQKSTQKART